MRNTQICSGTKSAEMLNTGNLSHLLHIYSIIKGKCKESKGSSEESDSGTEDRTVVFLFLSIVLPSNK